MRWRVRVGFFVRAQARTTGERRKVRRSPATWCARGGCVEIWAPLHKMNACLVAHDTATAGRDGRAGGGRRDRSRLCTDPS